MDILVADDSKFMRTIYRQIIDDTPHTIVASVTNGTAVLNAAKHHDPDVVVLNHDVKPSIDALIQRVKNHNPGAHVIRTDVSAPATTPADDVLIKPISDQELVDAINAAGSTTDWDTHFDDCPYV